MAAAVTGREYLTEQRVAMVGAGVFCYLLLCD